MNYANTFVKINSEEHFYAVLIAYLKIGATPYAQPCIYNERFLDLICDKDLDLLRVGRDKRTENATELVLIGKKLYRKTSVIKRTGITTLSLFKAHYAKGIAVIIGYVCGLTLIKDLMNSKSDVGFYIGVAGVVGITVFTAIQLIKFLVNKDSRNF